MLISQFIGSKDKIYHAVEKTPYRKDELKIFLAGTIDNGDSEDWQTKICKLIEECTTNSKPIAVYNPFLYINIKLNKKNDKNY